MAVVFIMKRYILHFILLFLLALSACEDPGGESTTIRGNLFDYYTNQPLASHQILISEKKYNYVAPPSIFPFDTTYTDANGHFYYNFETADQRGYEFTIDVFNNYCSLKEIPIAEGKSRTYDITLKPLKILKLTLIDTSNIYTSIDGQIESDWFNSEYAQNDTLIFFLKSIPEFDHTLRIHYSKYGNNIYRVYNFSTGLEDTTCYMTEY